MHPIAHAEGRLRRASVAWPLIGAALLMESGWVIAGAASPRISESSGFTDAFLNALPPIWAWAEGLRRTQTPENTSKFIFVAGLSVASVGYAVAIAAALRWRAGRLNTITIAGLVLFAATLLVTPGLLSTDLVTYAVYGRMGAVYGLNPYLATPPTIGGDALVGWTSWTFATPYGPLWTWIGVALGVVTEQAAPLLQVLPYRFIGVAAHATNAYLVWRLVPYVTSGATSRAVAVLLFAWNPLALFELIASGHNDGLMLTLTLSGLLLAFSRSTLLGSAVVWTAALVKWVPAVSVMYLISFSINVLPAWQMRARWLAGLTAILAVLTLLLFGPWIDARDITALSASLNAGGERYVNALVDLPTAWLASHLVDRGGTDVSASQAAVRAWTFGFARVLLLLYALFEWWRARADPRGVLRASVRLLLVALLFAVTQVLAWYFTWPLALAAPLGWSSNLARLVVAYTVLYLPIFYAIHENMLSTIVAPAVLVLNAVLPVVLVMLLGRSRLVPLLVSRTGEAAA